MSEKQFSEPVSLAFEARKIVSRRAGDASVEMAPTGLVMSGFVVGQSRDELVTAFEEAARSAALNALGQPVRSYVYPMPWQNPTDALVQIAKALYRDDNLKGMPEEFDQRVPGLAVPQFQLSEVVSAATIATILKRFDTSVFDLAALLAGPVDGADRARIISELQADKPVQVPGWLYASLVRLASSHPCDKKMQDGFRQAVLARAGAPAKVA